MSRPVGRVLGTLDSMPLEFWVGVAEGEYLQLDDVVVVESPLPDGRAVRLFGVVDIVRARHEGAKEDRSVLGDWKDHGAIEREDIIHHQQAGAQAHPFGTVARSVDGGDRPP